MDAVSLFMINREHAFAYDTAGRLWNDLPHGPWRVPLKFFKKARNHRNWKNLSSLGGGVHSWGGSFPPWPHYVKPWGGNKYQCWELRLPSFAVKDDRVELWDIRTSEQIVTKQAAHPVPWWMVMLKSRSVQDWVSINPEVTTLTLMVILG